MDKFDPDLVNLHHTQVAHSDVTRVHLHSEQEDRKLLKPDVVDRIRELSGQGLGSKRIAGESGSTGMRPAVISPALLRSLPRPAAGPLA